MYVRVRISVSAAAVQQRDYLSVINNAQMTQKQDSKMALGKLLQKYAPACIVCTRKARFLGPRNRKTVRRTTASCLQIHTCRANMCTCIPCQSSLRRMHRLLTTHGLIPPPTSHVQYATDNPSPTHIQTHTNTDPHAERCRHDTSAYLPVE